MAATAATNAGWPHRLRVLLVLGALAAGLILGAVAANGPLPHACDFHPISQFAGSTQEFTEQLHASTACRNLTENQAEQALWIDTAYAAAYGAALFVLTKHWWRSWRNSRLRDLHVIAVAGLFAAAFDIIENVLTYNALTTRDDSVALRSDGLARAISCVATLKWTLFVIAVVAAVASACASLSARARGLPEPGAAPCKPADDDRVETGAVLGVCCSGGGIRAASYVLGALDVLEERGVLDRARWLSAVSGGAYAATGWTLRRNDNPGQPAARSMIDHLVLDHPPSTVLEYRYLSSGRGGFTRAVFRSLLIIGFNLLVIALFVVAVSWPIGRAVSSRAVAPQLRLMHVAPENVSVPVHLWLPGVALVVLGVLIASFRAVVNGGGPKPFARVGLAIACVGIVSLVFFLVLPLTLALLDQILRRQQSNVLHAISAFLSIGFVASLVRVLTSRLTKIASRLGGILLALLLFIAGGWIASGAAHGGVPWLLWASCTAGLVVLFLVPIQGISLRAIYRDGLRRAFTSDPQLPGLDAVRWKDLKEATPGKAGNLPELVVCSAMQQVGLSPGGIPATSLTVSRSGLRAFSRIGAGSGTADSRRGFLVDMDRYTAQVPGPFGAELATVSGWMAVSGAAFSSAMGRQGMGSTNALMAAFNIDLGAWIPNPWLVREDVTQFPKIRLPYLVKEIMGTYDYDDENVFVSDGGQWENLGLVELFRRRCRTIVCVDASGDSPGTFHTLAEAISLAAAALPFDVTVTRTMDDLLPQKGEIPKTTVACFALRYEGGDEPTVEGHLLYARLQVAADQNKHIVEFASRDKKFPNYPTTNQFLSREQVVNLIAAGRDSATHLADKYHDELGIAAPST